MNKTSLEISSRYWDACASINYEYQYWTKIPAVILRLNEKVSGNSQINWIEYTLNRYFLTRLPIKKCLSLGCGEGWLERKLASWNTFQECDAYDISKGAIDLAKIRAIDQGYTNINYVIKDINKIVLPVGEYDVVWASGSIHHKSVSNICLSK